MSFVITAYVREGIVMAADSRLTLTTEENSPMGVIRQTVPQSDANQKLFLSKRNIGISTHGTADINGVPLGGFVESFILEKLESEPHTPESVATLLRSYLRGIKPDLDSIFHVCGYRERDGKKEQDMWVIHIKSDTQCPLAAAGIQGASWGGESDVMSRLFGRNWVEKTGGGYEERPRYNLQFQYFTLQDAVDFCVYGVRTTIDTLRFLPRAKTVGGPIDVLVIQPTKADWIQKKELRVRDA
jgi:hypothetical protein